MKWARPVVLALASMILWAVGCQTSAVSSSRVPSSSSSSGFASEAVSPPDGLDAKQLLPLTGALRLAAQQSLDDIVAKIPKPDALNQPPLTDPITASVLAAPPELSVQRAYVAGRAAWKSGDHVGAIRQLQTALRLTPSNVTVLRLLGRVFTEAGNPVRGAFYLQKALVLEPDDPATLYLLGRFALEQHLADQAIVYLALARKAYGRQMDTVDPALAQLIDYHLGSALLRAGYASAAIESLNAYLTLSRDGLYDSIWGREVLFLDHQRGSVRVALGDLHHQLGQPSQALQDYEQAKAWGFSDSLGLIRRLVYSHLCLGQPAQAQAIVLKGLTSQNNQPQMLGLLSYLVKQGVNASQMIDYLQAFYRREGGESVTRVLALSELVEDLQGQAMLAEHLQKHAEDQAVFEAWIRRATANPPLAEDDLREILRLTAQAMAQSPTHARAYAGLLLSHLSSVAEVIRLTEGRDQSEAHQNMLLVLRGLALASQAQMDEAGQAFEQALALDPQVDLARLEWVRLALVTGDFEFAQRLLEPLADRDDPQIVQLRVRVLSQTDQKPQAMALLDQMLAGDQAPARLYLEKARLQIQQQDLQGAEQTLLDALNQTPQAEALYMALFEIYDAMPNATKPYQRLMRRMLGEIPHSRIARLKRAEWLEARGELGQAQTLLDELLDENPNDVQAIAGLLQVYVRSQRRKEADQLLEQHLAQKPTPFALLRVASAFYEQVKDQKRLLQITERLLLLAPDNARRAEHLGQLYLDTQRPEEAQTVLRQAMNNPKIKTTDTMIALLWQTLIQLGQEDQALTLVNEQLAGGKMKNPLMLVQLRWRTLWTMGRGDQAEQSLKKAMTRFPDLQADLGYDLAMLITMRGDRPRAEQYLAELAQKYPDHADINNDLAYSWAVQNRNLDQALTMAQRVVAGNPENAAYLDSLGWVLYKLGRFDQAAMRLRQALGQVQRQARKTGQKDVATLAVVGDHLGDALYRAGHPDQAVKFWNLAQVQAATLPVAERADPTSDFFEMTDRLAAKIKAVNDAALPLIADVPGIPVAAPVPPVAVPAPGL